MNSQNYYVYISTNPRRTVLYIGVTDDLTRRLYEHYENRGNDKTFAGKYYCYKLIYYEHYFDITQAIMREKELKNMTRRKKVDLIKSKNPKWEFYLI